MTPDHQLTHSLFSPRFIVAWHKVLGTPDRCRAPTTRGNPLKANSGSDFPESDHQHRRTAMSYDIKPMAPGGKSPDCGNNQFLLAKDITQYTLVYQDATDPEDPWCYDERDTQPIDSVNGEPTVRLFCTECGAHVIVPEEMQ